MKILVIDDEVRTAQMLADQLCEAGHEARALSSGEAAIEAIEQEPFDVVFTDLKMAPVDGLAVLEAVKRLSPETEVVLMTAYGSVETAVPAMKQGAYDYLGKPFGLDEAALLLDRIGEKRRLRRENAALRQELRSTDRFAEMVGTSAALAKVKELVAKVSQSDSTVLVLGESGVGKELVARMIHRQSRRAGRAFAVVHAAALPDTLLESELFGYERGAFTGAQGRKPGRLEEAQGGTLFLDEIGEISAAFQVKLLRFLQDKSFLRLGGSQVITVDARVIAATNRDIEAEVRAGKFREDLYYRLSVFPITVPPLRERRTDIAHLARHILVRLGYNRPASGGLLELLADYDWPGNVRELENVLERAMIMASGEELGYQHIQLPEPVLARGTGTGVRGQGSGQGQSSLSEMEEQMLRDALSKAGGNKAKAARLLGITRRMLYTKLAKYGMAEESEEVTE